MNARKWLHMFTLISAFFLFNSTAQAFELYGFASYWDKGDIDGKAGFGIGLGVPIFDDNIRFDSRIHFIKDSTFDGNDELTLIPFDVGLQAHLMPGMGLDPYALAGVSFIYADADRSDVDSSFGGYLGGGVTWTPFHIASFFGEAVYRFHELSGSRGSHINLSGMSLNIGVRFFF